MDNAGDVVTENVGEGIDWVHSALTYALGAEVENLTLTGATAINGTGNALDNVLTGNSAANVLFGRAGDDTLDGGAGADILFGGAGNDTLIGGPGSDAYIIFIGGGRDTIIDHSTANGSGFTDFNVVYFPDLVGDNSLILEHGSLLIRYGDSGDAIDIMDFDPMNPLGPHAIDIFQFADGTELSYSDLIGRGFDLTGTDGDDTIIGTSVVDRITGLNGNDVLQAGAGNDILAGGAGDDTYLFSLGDGFDTIHDTAAPGEDNRIVFGAGITRADLTFTQGTNTLTIAYGTGGDTIVLDGFDPTNAHDSLVVSTLQFADDSQVNLADLFAPVNTAPTVTSVATASVAENTAWVTTVAATDPDAGDTQTFSISGGVDAAQFAIDSSTGVLTFGSAPNFEGPTDVGTNNVYDVIVKVADSGGLFDTQAIAVTVTNVNEAPVVTSVATASAAENTVGVLYQATRSEVDANDPATWSLGGADALKFAMNASTGEVSFVAPPNYEAASDADGNNVYDLTVTATDVGGLFDTQAIAVTVTNVNEAPVVTNPIVDQSAQPGAAFAFTVPTNTFADDDLGDTLTYSATLANGSALPAWLSFNSTTRAFSGTPSSGDAGLVSIKVSATDTGSLTVSDVFDLTVTATQDQVLTGTAGNDVLTGAGGNDQLYGLAGNDTLSGGAGNDLLDGGSGGDALQGGLGDDMYVVDNIADVVTELTNEGTDTVQSALLAYTLGANVENLTLTGTGPNAGIGNALNNLLVGNSGANLLDGKGGADTMRGGAGDDLYFVDNIGDTVVEQAGEGTLDTVSSSVSYALSANVENLVLTGTAAINGTGNVLDNILTGNSGANVLTGRAGNDTYVIGTGDTVVEAMNEGTDTVVSGITHTLAANVENLTLIGFSAINGTGNALDNVLSGLLNLAGNTLTGGAGNDTYILGSGDQVVEAANGGTDRVQAGFSYTLGSNVENLTLTGTEAINGTGNSLNNTMTGNSANNTLNGANGNDTLRGGLGDDTVNGGIGNDTFLFGRGDGQDLIQDSSGSADKMLFDGGINPLDLVISRQANNLRLSIHGSSDQITVQNWYTSSVNRTETIQAGNGQTLLSSQVDGLIQAMAQFSANHNGMTWDQGIVAKPEEVQEVLAASWQ